MNAAGATRSSRWSGSRRLLGAAALGAASAIAVALALAWFVKPAASPARPVLQWDEPESGMLFSCQDYSPACGGMDFIVLIPLWPGAFEGSGTGGRGHAGRLNAAGSPRLPQEVVATCIATGWSHEVRSTGWPFRCLWGALDMPERQRPLHTLAMGRRSVPIGVLPRGLLLNTAVYGLAIGGLRAGARRACRLVRAAPGACRSWGSVRSATLRRPRPGCHAYSPAGRESGSFENR